MNQISRDHARPSDNLTGRPPRKRGGPGRGLWIGLAIVAIAGGGAWYAMHGQASHRGPMMPPPPHVTTAHPLQQNVAVATSFLGQFSAVDSVELRAQVGGILTAINFTDGQIVHKGDPLFTIDPRPYQVKLEQAAAQVQTALAHKVLTAAELWRAQQLKRNDYGSMENVDQRAADDRAAAAAIDTARATLTDAQLDLEYARITAPFTGKIGAHLVSVGNLVSGSRGGTSPTTLLATIVSLDPIYLDFDMSETDYIAFQQSHPGETKAAVRVSRNGDGAFAREGVLDFVDNQVNKGSGTIHVRATVPNHDLALTPGAFARLELPIVKAAKSLLVPATAIVPDQSQMTVMVVDHGKAAPRIVQTGALYHGLRIVTSGLKADDDVIIDGLMLVRPGSPVVPAAGKITPDSTNHGA